MADNTTILVGTVGQGVVLSADASDSWKRAGIEDGLHSDAMVRALAHHPSRLKVIYAGTDADEKPGHIPGAVNIVWEQPDR